MKYNINMFSWQVFVKHLDIVLLKYNKLIYSQEDHVCKE